MAGESRRSPLGISFSSLRVRFDIGLAVGGATGDSRAGDLLQANPFLARGDVDVAVDEMIGRGRLCRDWSASSSVSAQASTVAAGKGWPAGIV
jgi:hypothetical protein